jgi:uncharacterized membrane protein YgcG
MSSLSDTDMKKTEINEYYIQKYQYLSGMYINLIYLLVALIILAVINNTGLLPNAIFIILFSIILAAGFIYYIYKMNSYLSRSNTVFTQYNWKFTPGGTSTDKTSGSFNSSSFNGVCYNGNCCGAGQTWNASITKCVSN